MTEDDGKRRAVLIIIAVEDAPGRRLRAEQREEVRRDGEAWNPRRVVIAGQREIGELISGSVLEDIVLIAPIGEVRVRNATAGDAA